MRQAFNLENSNLDPDFCRWAFGCERNDPKWDHAIELMQSWNERHGEKLMLKGSNEIHKDLALMGGIWATEGYPDGR